MVLAHVLIDGESRILAEVHDFLRQWGLTVGRLPEAAGARGLASEAECDVVIFLCEKDQDGSEARGGHLKSVPPEEREPLGWEEPAAPLLVIGRGRLAETMGGHACQHILEIGPGGSQLRKALEICLAKQGRIGSMAPNRGDRDQQLHFLGHELRSPLTALKTALEVVQGDLGGVSGLSPEGEMPASDRSRLRMLEIALRNVRRMHHAVEWSQSLLKFEDSRPQSARRQISLSRLAEELGPISGNEARIRGRDLTIECDADLLLHVAHHAIQEFRFGKPDLELALSLDLEAAGPNRLQLEIRCPGRPCSDSREATLHLQRFADFLNPSGSLVRAGGQVRVCGGPDEGPGLALTLEFQPVAAQRLTLVG